MSDIKAELKTKCTKLKKKDMCFYFYEKIGTIIKHPVLLMDIAGTVKSESKVFSKKHKTTHTCRGLVTVENKEGKDQIVFFVEQGSHKSLEKALKQKPFKGTAITQAEVRKGKTGDGDDDENSQEEQGLVATATNSQKNIDNFERRYGKVEAALESIKDVLKEWKDSDQGGWKDYSNQYKDLSKELKECFILAKKDAKKAYKQLDKIKGNARKLHQLIDKKFKESSVNFKGSDSEIVAVQRRLEKVNLEIQKLEEVSNQWSEDKPIGWQKKKMRLDADITALKKSRDAAVKLGAKDAKKAYKQLDSVKTDARKMAQKAQKLLDQTPQPTPLKIGKRNIQIDDRIVPGLDKMDPAEKQAALEEITAKMEKGQKTLNNILSGEPRDYKENPPTKEEVAEMMWYIRGMAEDKAGESFLKNALTIPDPNNNFHKFIEACSNTHSRASSHVHDARDAADTDSDFEKTSNKGEGRGIDFNSDDITLPYDLKTALFHSLEFENADGTKENRVYIKMETAGFTMKPKDMEEVVMSLTHAKNYITSRFKHSDGGMSAYREKVPKPVQKQYQALMKLLAVSKPLLKVLKTGEYKKNIFQMVKNIDAIFEDEEAFNELEEGLGQKIIEELMSFSDILKDEVGSDIEDKDLQHRVGGEIVLEMGDLQDTEDSDEDSDEDSL